MVHLGTGILLLYMAVGALGKGGRGGRGSGSGGSGGGDLVGAGLDWVGGLFDEDSSDASSPEFTTATTDSTYVIYTPPSTATYEPSTISSVITEATSAPSSAAPVSTGGVDLIRLFGPDARPDIFHLEAVGEVQDLSDATKAILQTASTVLLALTKSTPDGRWIKSMFGLPGQIGSINEGPEIVNVTLTGLENVMKGEQTVIKGLQSMKIEKSNLSKLAEMGIGSDQITEPWWPWALIEGALQATGGLATNNHIQEYECMSLLKCFTGKETKYQAHQTSGTYADGNEKFAAADHTPIIFRQEDDTWGVVMRAPFANDKGEEQIGWAGPWPTEKNNREKEFNSYSPTADFRFGALVFIEGLPTFEQTREI